MDQLNELVPIIQDNINKLSILMRKRYLPREKWRGEGKRKMRIIK